MTFLTISKEAQGLLTFWVSLVEILLFFNFFRYAQIGRRKSNTRCIALCAGDFLLAQILFQQMNGDMLCPVALPLWLLILVIALFTVLAVVEQVRILSWSYFHVSAMSIKEALDALPTGLCFALPEGAPILVNETMEELGRRLLNKPLLNAEEFWQSLERGDGKGRLREGSDPIFELPDGRVFCFRREKLMLREGEVFEIYAMDITEEYSKTQELTEKQKRAEVNNARLKAILGTIEYVTMNRELLQIKIALHDNLGRSLLSAKRYILNPGTVDLPELLSLWRQNLTHLIGETPEEWQVPYYVTKKEAATLGVDMQIVGTLPEEERYLPLIDQAISTHVINVLRHAGGHVAMVHIWEDEREYSISFTNDGKVPSGEIKETGGIGNIKRQAETLGGSLALSHSPRFEMVLRLPKETG